MKQFQINMLGGLHIAGATANALTRKVKAVAAYLALRRGQPQSREKVAALFWEHSPEDQARTNLRQCLSTLRKQFGNALVTDTEKISLDAAAVDTDVSRFEKLVGKNDLAALETAVEIYQGDLLDSFGLKEDAFEAWIRTERERYRNLMVDGLSRLINHYESANDTGTTARLATRLLALDPLNEMVHRSLMRAFAAQGRCDAALRQYEICKKTLVGELGVQPQPETVTLFRQLKSDRSKRVDVQTTRASSGFVAPELNDLDIDTSTPDKPSVILLPFKDLSANGEFAHLAEGIRIDVQCALVKISGLFVIAAGSASIYADRAAPPEQVAQEMGVQYVLECSIQGSADKVRITAQLTDGLNRQVVWSERYDRELDETFIVQDEIAEKIVTSLDVKLVSGEQAKVWRKTLREPRALELYYKGLELLIAFDKQSVEAARQLFEKVSEISPDVTLGPTGVAFCYYWDVTMGWGDDREHAMDLAALWSERAAAMEDASGEAHAILAHIQLLRGEHAQALEIAEEAIRIRPMCANTNALSGNVLLYCGRPRQAIDRVKSAMRYAPMYASWWLGILASAYRDIGQYELAIAACEELLRKTPDNTNGLLIMASVLVEGDRLQAAKEYAEKILSMDPKFSLSRYADQHPYQNEEQLQRQVANLQLIGLPK